MGPMLELNQKQWFAKSIRNYSLADDTIGGKLDDKMTMIPQNLQKIY